MYNFEFLKSLFFENSGTYLDIIKRAESYADHEEFVELIDLWCEGIAKRLERSRSGAKAKTDITRFRVELELWIGKAITSFSSYPERRDVAAAVKELEHKQRIFSVSQARLDKYGVNIPLMGELGAKLMSVIDRYRHLKAGQDALREHKLRTALNELQQAETLLLADELLQKAYKTDEQARAYFSEALRLLAENNLDSAQIAYDQGHSLNTESDYLEEIPSRLSKRKTALGLLAKAQTAMLSGDIDRSLQLAREARNTDEAADRNNLYDSITEAVAQRYYKLVHDHLHALNLEEALRHCRLVQQVQPDFKDIAQLSKELTAEWQTVQAAEQRGREAIQQGDPQGAQETLDDCTSRYRFEQLDALRKIVQEQCQEAEKWCVEARHALSTGHYQQAVQVLENLAEKYPLWRSLPPLQHQANINVVAHNALLSAKQLLSQKQLFSVQTELQGIPREADDYQEAQRLLQTIQAQLEQVDELLLEAERELADNELDKVQRHLAAAREIHPHDQRLELLTKQHADYGRAEKAYQAALRSLTEERNVIIALQQIDEALTSRPHFPVYMAAAEKIRSVAAECRKHWEESEQRMQEGDLVASIEALQFFVEQNWHYQDARTSWQSKSETLQKIESLWMPRALTLFEQGQYVPCRTQLDQILSAFPRHAAALALEKKVIAGLQRQEGLSRVKLLRQQNDYPAALRELRNLLSLYPQEITLQEALHETMQQYAEQGLAQVTALEQQRKLESARGYLAQMQKELEPQAIEDRLNALDNTRNLAKSLHSDGQRAMAERSFDHAQACFKRALSLNVELSIAELALKELDQKRADWQTFLQGQEAEKKGNFTDAVHYYKKAHQAFPEAAEITAALESAQSHLGIRGAFILQWADEKLRILPQRFFKIGRNTASAQENVLALTQPCISRKLAQIQCVEDEFVYSDLSAGATVFKKALVDRHVIHHGDLLEIWTRDKSGELVEPVAELLCLLPHEVRMNRAKRKAITGGPTTDDLPTDRPALLIRVKEYIFDRETEKVNRSEACTRREDYLFMQDSALVGSSEQCEIQINDKTVSEIHAVLFRRDSRFFLRDLNSQNGTYVDGELVNAEHQLCFGDQIQIGRITAVVKEETL